jgi:hypothetical protein
MDPPRHRVGTEEAGIICTRQLERLGALWTAAHRPPHRSRDAASHQFERLVEWRGHPPRLRASTSPYDAGVPRFLSDEWIAEMDAAASSAPSLVGVLPDDANITELVIEHVVDDDGDERAYHLVLGTGPARARQGHADTPTITFRQGRATAAAIASGASSAQAAFMAGDLRLGGRVDLLLTHHGALTELDDVFADVRARTEW